MNYQQARDFVDSFSKSGKPVTDLSRAAALMQAVGDPHEQLRFIHIAGTNGKGSTAEYLTNILKNSGYRTGTLTSPYIRHYRDRIRLNGADIPKDRFTEICTQVSGLIGELPCSQFEITMAIALLYFQQEGADVVVLETGIGGLLDSTNMIAPPLVSIITSVSMDHMQVLGSTLAEIAAQKAGILKKGSAAVFSCDSKKEALDVLTSTAQERECPYTIPDPDACEVEECGIAGSRFTYHGISCTLKMGGMHQIRNAMTVLEAVKILREKGYALPDSAVQQGLAETAVPARMQVLQQDPLVILDGGHNADGVGALVRALDESGVDNWIGICGMTDTKDKDAAAFQLALVLNRVLCVDGFTQGAVPKEELQAAFVRQHAMALPMELDAALPYALKWAKGSHGAVVICGSLYLANHFLNQSEA
ncbi:MAG: bifunctional folylpolyglutamate synthase/dihydrofolate synthase [Oscillospiraceae bacterium]|nr:bifunctional folylpolyglutamate synthase/dihydrofolate synthase [Oscillospiraceae bacterium]